MSDDRLDLTDEERASLSPAERELVTFAEQFHDPADDDRRFGDLPYDDLLDEYGKPVI